MSQEIVEQVKDFPMQWIFAQYELGRPVSEIAAEMKISENRVYEFIFHKGAIIRDLPGGFNRCFKLSSHWPFMKIGNLLELQ